MSTTFPTSLDVYTTKTDGVSTMRAADVNDLQDAVLALERVSVGPTWLNVRAYGAVGNGVTDDTAALQATLNAAPSGSAVFLPPGTYYITSTLSITKALTLFGNHRDTIILLNDTVSVGISIATDSQVVIRDLKIKNTSKSNTSTHIVVDGGTHGVTYNEDSVFYNLRLTNPYIGIDVQSAAALKLHSIHFDGVVAKGLQIDEIANPDYGDISIVNCQFLAAYPYVGTTNAIYHVAGGGVRIIGSKFFYHTYQYHLNLRASASTSILIIEGNSFDGNADNVVMLEHQAGATGFDSITITGNTFACGNTIGVKALATTADISKMAVVGNTFRLATTGTGVSIDGVSKGVVTGNQFFGGGGTTKALVFANAVADWEVGPNSYSGITTKLTIPATGVRAHLESTGTWDPPNVVDGAMTSTTVPVTGADVGDIVTVGFSQALSAGMILSGAVTVGGVVTVTLFNKSGGAVDLASGTLRVDVYTT